MPATKTSGNNRLCRRTQLHRAKFKTRYDCKVLWPISDFLAGAPWHFLCKVRVMANGSTRIKKNAIIIGGGISGLVAARELACGGMDVTMLEAKNRLGGRIHTIADSHFPIELGAEFVHGESRMLMGAIREAGLTTQAVPSKNRLFINGNFEEIKIWDIADEIFKRVNPHEPDCSFGEFLARQSAPDSTTKTARAFVESFDAADVNRISSHALLRAEYAAEQMNGSRQFRISRGYQALIDYLERQVKLTGGIILKNTAARIVRWNGAGVEVLADHGNRPNNFRADIAVITLPVGILKRNELKFEPSLPHKMDAVQELQFGNVVKMVFQFRNSFWENCGFIHALDEPIPTWWNDSRGPVLNGWAGGPKADALLSSSHNSLETLGLEILSRLFSTSVGSLRKEFVAAHYWNWADDPQIRGAYSYIPVNGLELPKALAAPVADTLFFAGEATVSDAQTGTVFGALESGLRAAGEILEREQKEILPAR